MNGGMLRASDARLNVYGALGLKEGDAHVIRNAGGVITEDEIRSLAISQRLLGTKEIILIHHTDCGMLTFTDDEFKNASTEETGLRPAWAPEALSDPAEDVKQSIRRVAGSPFIPHRDQVRGFVFNVATGALEEVHASSRCRVQLLGILTKIMRTKPTANTVMMPRMPQYWAPPMEMNTAHSVGVRKLTARPVVA